MNPSIDPHPPLSQPHRPRHPLSRRARNLEFSFLFAAGGILALLTAAATAPAATLDVTKYGANPNGSGDDTAGIQAAITASVAGDEVFLPAGVYRISDSLSPKSNTKLYGAGAGATTLLYIGTKPHSMIKLANVTALEVAALTLDGAGSTAVTDAIVADICTTLNFHDLGIQNIGTPKTGGDGVHLAQKVTDSRFQNCTFSNIGVGNPWSSAFRISWGSSRNIISGNTIDHTGRGGILCNDNSTDLIIQHNTITRSGGEQLSIELWGGKSCDRAVVEDNTVDHWISISGSSFCAVRRNTVGTTNGTNSLTALECVASHDSIFTDTVSRAGNELGISVSAGPEQYDFFAYNTFTNQTNWGAQIQGDSRGATCLYFYKDKYQSGLNNSSRAYYPPAGNAFRINENTHSLTLDSVSITNNPGAAIQIYGVGSTVDALSVVNCTITGNKSVQGWGGSFSNLQWENNTVSGNGNNSVPTSVGFSDAAPVAVINGPSTATPNQPVTFTSVSTDAGGTIAHTLWDLNAGLPVAAESATYTYTKPGVYRISLLVWGKTGRGAHAEKTLTVLPPAVTLETEPLSGASQTASINH